MAVSRIASITVPVQDHDRALALYQTALGFCVIRDDATEERGREVHMTAPGDASKRSMQRRAKAGSQRSSSDPHMK